MGTRHTDDGSSEHSGCDHSFEPNDEITEFCVFCGKIRKYATRERTSVATTADEIHTCRAVGDHAFGLDRVCLYCRKPEGDLTQAERELRRAIRRERRGAVGDEAGLGLFDD